MNVKDRFLEYVKYDTQSDPTTGLNPSTPGQLFFAQDLYEEMLRIGMSDVELDENGYLMGFIPSNISDDIPTIGFIAHLDTPPSISGKNVKAKITENYDGKEIIINEEKNIIISPDESPELRNYIGHNIITAGGNTILGADGKAGIAELMTAMEYIIDNEDIKHGRIAVCFTPDEEIRGGTDLFNIENFSADFAYTIDGEGIGSIEYENFYAAKAKIVFKGKSYHTGYAKDRMINSIHVARKFIDQLPNEEIPEKTDGIQGFFHVDKICGEVEETTLEILIRDFDQDSFENRKYIIEKQINDFSRKYKGDIQFLIKDQYKNMSDIIKPLYYIIDLAKEAMEEADIIPNIKPIRGGTEGAYLSYMGLPTPNIFSGSENIHGKYEYISVQAMEKAVEVIINIVKKGIKLNKK